MSRLNEILAEYDAKIKAETPAPENQATPAQSGLIQGVSRLAGAPLDLPPMLAQMMGANVQTPGATQQIQQGLEQAFDVKVGDPDGLMGDLITDFLTGATETAPYAYAGGGPVAGTIGTIGAGVLNAIVERPFFDDKPLLQFAVEFTPIGGAPAVSARAPKPGFDPQRPLTSGEAATSPFASQTDLLRMESRSSQSPENIQAETARSTVIENTLENDLNILSNPDITSVSAAREAGQRLQSRIGAYQRQLSQQADKLMADVPDIKINFTPIRTSLLKRTKRGELTEKNQSQALNLYADIGSNVKSINVKTFHEEMKRVGEVAYGDTPITETAFYRQLLNSNNKQSRELAKILTEMPEQSLRQWGRTVYRKMNNGLTEVVKEGGQSGQAARALTNFKTQVSQNIENLERLRNEPLVKFFGDDFHTLNARELAQTLQNTDPTKVKQFSAMLRRSNPEAYEKLRETVFHGWLDQYKVRGPKGQTMIDWERLTDPKALDELKSNGFLLEGGDYTAFSQTMKALQKMQRKFDPDVRETPAVSNQVARNTIDSLVQTLRAPAYKAAIVTQGLVRLVRGLSMQSPKNLSLFTSTELQMINRVARGEQLSKKNAEKLTEKMNRLSSVLFITPVTTMGGRSAAAQQPQQADTAQPPSRLESLLERAQPQQEEAPGLFFSP